MRQTVTAFLDFVEIRTKLATVLPFLIALAYVFYTTGRINLHSTLIYFVAALMLDMSVTAINNHFNTREEKKPTHYSSFKSLAIIGGMLVVFAGLGLYLVYLHGLTILFAGVFCLLVGVAYSYGPAPICKTPYGEAASGFTIGTVVTFIVISINNPYFTPLGLSFCPTELRLMLNMDLPALILFGLVTLPAVFCIANIMLANNICDEQADRSFRYTLVHSIGVSKSLKLFSALYYCAYATILCAVILRQIPPWTLLVFLTYLPVRSNIRRFREKQSKAETFVLSVKNATMILLAYAITIAIGGLLQQLP